MHLGFLIVPDHSGIGGRCDIVLQGKIPMSTEGIPRIIGASGVWSYLMVWSIRSLIGVTIAKIIRKYINPKGQRYLHLGKSN